MNTQRLLIIATMAATLLFGVSYIANQSARPAAAQTKPVSVVVGDGEEGQAVIEMESAPQVVLYVPRNGRDVVVDAKQVEGKVGA